MRHVRAKYQQAPRETVDFIQTAEAKLSVLESVINLVAYVLSIELLY